MPWDNSVNKMAHIYAIVTTIDVKNMPSTTACLIHSANPFEFNIVDISIQNDWFA